MKNLSRSIFQSMSIGSAIGSLLISFGQPASALQFKKLIETGQTIPGNNQPLTVIESPTIGRDGQAAVYLKTKSVTVNGSDFFSTTQFVGIYSIGQSGNISLLDQGATVSSARTATVNTFTAPSISQGKIAYLTYSLTSDRGSESTPISILKVGTPGDVKQYGNIISGYYVRGIPNVSFTNGMVYGLETSLILSRPPIDGGRVKLLNINSPTPAFTTLSTSVDNTAIRSGSQSVVLLSVDPNKVHKLFERPNNGPFVQLNPQGQNPGSCGFAVSSENVVSCSVAGSQYVLSVRFGKASNFVSLPLPNAATLKSVSDPSISNNKIIFKTTEQDPNGSIVEKIYLSNKNQAPQLIVSSGQVIDGKTITGLKLNTYGRTIADNYVVFIGTFSDSSQALYRIDL